MKKVRSNALWNKLSPENRETLDTWLFEEHLGYAAVLPKAQQELGFKGSIGSLKRYGKRREQERLVTDLVEVGKDAAKVCEAGASPDTLRLANMRVLSAYLFKAMRENPSAIKELAPMIKAILQNDYNETIREMKRKELQIREEALAFTKQKYQKDMVEQALQALPDLLELQALRREPDAGPPERNAQLERVRQRLFGTGGEATQEEAVIPAAKPVPEAQRQTERERTTQPGQESITEPPPHSRPDFEERQAAKVGKELAEQEREKVYRERQEQAAAAVEAAKVEQEKLREQQAAERAEQKKQREERAREKQKRFEEMRELCGWQEVEKPPGWEDWE